MVWQHGLGRLVAKTRTLSGCGGVPKADPSRMRRTGKTAAERSAVAAAEKVVAEKVPYEETITEKVAA